MLKGSHRLKLLAEDVDHCLVQLMSRVLLPKIFGNLFHNFSVQKSIPNQFQREEIWPGPSSGFEEVFGRRAPTTHFFFIKSPILPSPRKGAPSIADRTTNLPYDTCCIIQKLHINTMSLINSVVFKSVRVNTATTIMFLAFITNEWATNNISRVPHLAQCGAFQGENTTQGATHKVCMSPHPQLEAPLNLWFLLTPRTKSKTARRNQ